jgi:phosphoribosylaminoimidazole (AIR) synthetase
MRDVFNLGVGLIAVLPSRALAAAQAAAAADGVATWTMGEIRPGQQTVRFSGP